jgi:hypothetical protein
LERFAEIERFVPSDALQKPGVAAVRQTSEHRDIEIRPPALQVRNESRHQDGIADRRGLEDSNPPRSEALGKRTMAPAEAENPHNEGAQKGIDAS